MVISSERRKRLTLKIDKKEKEKTRDKMGEEWLLQSLKNDVELEGVLEDEEKIKMVYKNLECDKNKQYEFMALVTVSRNSKVFQEKINLKKREKEYSDHLDYLETKRMIEAISRDTKKDKERIELIANNVRTLIECVGADVIMGKIKEKVKDGVYKKAYDECCEVKEEDFEYFIDFSSVENCLMGKNIKDAFIENEKCIKVYRIRDGKKNKLKGGGYKTFRELFMKQHTKETTLLK